MKYTGHHILRFYWSSSASSPGTCCIRLNEFGKTLVLCVSVRITEPEVTEAVGEFEIPWEELKLRRMDETTHMSGWVSRGVKGKFPPPNTRIQINDVPSDLDLRHVK